MSKITYIEPQILKKHKDFVPILCAVIFTNGDVTIGEMQEGTIFILKIRNFFMENKRIVGVWKKINKI